MTGTIGSPASAPPHGAAATGQTPAAAWERLHGLHHDVQAELDHVLGRELGLTAVAVDVLLRLEPGPLQMARLAAFLGLTRSGTTRVIDRMETLGLVERKRAGEGDDQRSRTAALTASGHATLRNAAPVRAAVLERRFGASAAETAATESRSGGPGRAGEDFARRGRISSWPGRPARPRRTRRGSCACGRSPVM